MSKPQSVSDKIVYSNIHNNEIRISNTAARPFGIGSPFLYYFNTFDSYFSIPLI